MKVRCIDADWSHGRLVVGKTYDADEGGMVCHLGTRWMAERFEPVTDEPDKAACPKCGDDVGYSAEYAHCMGCGATDKDLLNLAFPCPKVDPYAEHRLRECSAVAMELHDRASGATARLHAGLESEKVRERVKAFPKPGRNFALKGGGDE